MFDSLRFITSAFFKQPGPSPAPAKKEMPLSLHAGFSELPPSLKNNILGGSDSFLPRHALARDILDEPERPAMPRKTFNSLQAMRINLLTRHSDNKNIENNEFLKESIIEDHLPLFDALLQTTEDPDLPSLLELAATEQNDEAFRKLASRVRNPLPQSTLRHVAECGDLDNLKLLLEKSDLNLDEKKALLALAKNKRRETALLFIGALRECEFDLN